jgi:hypothetical protein
MILNKAIKYIKPLKVLMYGPTYSGKTLSSLYLAAGIVASKRKCSITDAYKHIVLIDSEFGRGALYNKVGDYFYIQMTPPYRTELLASHINELELMDNIDIIIIDSLTHYWSKEGGILDQKAEKDQKGGNSYTNWQEFTSKFNRLLDTILASQKHIIVTSRAKSDTALVTDSGKAVPKTYGLKPELRDGIEFDFDIVFNIDKQSHSLITDKGVPGIELIYEAATPELGTKLYDLFNTDAVVKVRTIEEIAESLRRISKDNNMITFIQLKLSGRKLEQLTLDEITQIEKDLKAEIKKNQK